MVGPLVGKKLMILGANSETRSLVKKARSLGVITWVIDPNPGSSAKKCADFSLDLDGLDVDAIVGAAKTEKIDGVLVGVADSLVKSYQIICQSLGLPCYANPESIKALTSKEEFIKSCHKYGISTPPNYTIDNIPIKKNMQLEFPLMVKPVDRASGIGISICRDIGSLEEAYRFAKSISISKRAIIEKYMQCEDLHVYYTFIEGSAYLSAYGDRFTSDRQLRGSPVCIGNTYPGRFLDQFEKLIHPRLLDMFSGLKIMNGVLAIQFFHDKGNFYAYDPGFRLQGEGTHIHLLEANGFDHEEMLINFALRGKMTEINLSSLNDVRLKQNYACTVWILLGSGKISSISGLGYIKRLSSYRTHRQRLFRGDSVREDAIGTERQVLARIYFQNKNWMRLRSDIQEVHKKFRVLDEKKKSMIVDGLNKFREQWPQPELVRSI